MSRAANFLEEAGFTPLRISIYDYIIEHAPVLQRDIEENFHVAHSSIIDSLKFLKGAGLCAWRLVENDRDQQIPAFKKRGRCKHEWYIVGRD